MCKNAVLDVFEHANVPIKHQNHIQWFIKVIFPVIKIHFRFENVTSSFSKINSGAF